MKTNSPYIIDFTQISKSESMVLEYTLGDDFFALEEDGEILGGDVHLTITITPQKGDTYDLNFSYLGDVVVACDRCLDPVTEFMAVDDHLIVIIGDHFDDESDIEMILDARHQKHDFRHLIYEFLALHLPIQMFHEPGECNPEMTKYLVDEVPEEDEN